MDANTLVYRQAKVALIFLLIIGICLTPLFGIGLIIIIAALVSYMQTQIVVGPDYISVRKGWITKSDIDIPYAKVNSISVQRSWGFSFGTVLISTGNDVSQITLSYMENVNELKAQVQKRISLHHGRPDVQPQGHSAPQPEASSLDKLERLAKLKSAGAITSEEYDIEKRKIIGRQ
jgi:membrane protein YdbS with pleckstrin-like domain